MNQNTDVIFVIKVSFSTVQPPWRILFKCIYCYPSPVRPSSPSRAPPHLLILFSTCLLISFSPALFGISRLFSLIPSTIFTTQLFFWCSRFWSFPLPLGIFKLFLASLPLSPWRPTSRPHLSRVLYFYYLLTCHSPATYQLWCFPPIHSAHLCYLQHYPTASLLANYWTHSMNSLSSLLIVPPFVILYRSQTLNHNPLCILSAGIITGSAKSGHHITQYTSIIPTTKEWLSTLTLYKLILSSVLTRHYHEPTTLLLFRISVLPV